jgi:deazaflavin-dependent oxidoreductase (nitroreductase family)
LVGYFEDGRNLVTMATNGWGPSEPAWWLNLQAHPDVLVHLKGEAREVHARAATGDERARLWEQWRAIDKGLDALAARRPVPTSVVVFEPRDVSVRS